MATKTKTKTKTKIKDSLKNVFINELKGKKEEERLERVKHNATLREITIYIDKRNQESKPYTDLLEKEGVKFELKEISEHMDEWNQVAAKTNLAFFPTLYIQGEYIVNKRDFQNPQQCMGITQYLASPKLINPTPDEKIHEQMKTNQYNLYQRINQLDQKITPLLSFMTNLQKELSEEEGE